MKEDVGAGEKKRWERKKNRKKCKGRKEHKEKNRKERQEGRREERKISG